MITKQLLGAFALLNLCSLSAADAEFLKISLLLGDLDPRLELPDTGLPEEVHKMQRTDTSNKIVRVGQTTNSATFNEKEGILRPYLSRTPGPIRTDLGGLEAGKEAKLQKDCLTATITPTVTGETVGFVTTIRLGGMVSKYSGANIPLGAIVLLTHIESRGQMDIDHQDPFMLLRIGKQD